MKTQSTPFDRSFLDPLARLLIAVGGGLFSIKLWAAALAGWMPLAAVDATALGIMLAFVLFAAAGIWAFAATTLLRAISGLLIPSAVCLGLLLLQQGGAA